MLGTEETIGMLKNESRKEIGKEITVSAHAHYPTNQC